MPAHQHPVVAKFTHDFLVNFEREPISVDVWVLEAARIGAIPELYQFKQLDGQNGICFDYFLDKCINRGCKFHPPEKHRINDNFVNDAVAIIGPGMGNVRANGMLDREGYPHKKHRGDLQQYQRYTERRDRKAGHREGVIDGGGRGRRRSHILARG